MSKLVVLGRPVGTTAAAIAVERGRIVAIGSEDEVRAAHAGARVVGHGGATVVPGFVDAHLHLLALARRRLEVDCSVALRPAIADVLGAIRKASRATPAGAWIRAFGIDDALIAERRLPTLGELDEAAPARPLRLLHRTGHAALLNSVALGRLGLGDRHPNGLVHEQANVLAGRIPAAEGKELERTIIETSRELAARGVTTIHDPTPGQDLRRLRELAEHAIAGRVVQRLRLYGSEPSEIRGVDERRVRVAGVKLVVATEADAVDLALRLDELDREGVQVAIHAVEGGPLAATVAALGELGPERVRERRHRIEHASLVPPPLVEEIARLGATVVTHPIFADEFAEKYRSEVPEEQHEWLYPMAAWRRAGVPVALGSDAPIAPADPLKNLSAARRRGIDGREALDLHTRGGAFAANDEDRLGEIRVGAAADLVVLDSDPTGVDPDPALIAVSATVIAGDVAYER